MKARVLTLLLSLVLGGLLVVAPATQTAAADAPERRAARWEPPSGVIFNNPYGPVARFRIENRLVNTIKSVRRGGHIRISIYSFDRKNVARALVAAHRRGVQVQILFNDHQVRGAQRILHRALGTNPRRQNFAYECKNSCRGGRDFLHSKFYLFDRAGGATDVISVGSVNFTLNAVKWQWNDLMTIKGRTELFRDYVDLFNDMRRDYRTNQPYYTFCGKAPGNACHPTTDTSYTRVFPRKSSARNDAVLNMLEPIQCIYRTKHGTKRTELRLSMHTMQRTAGIYLARRIRQLYAAGCDFKVIYGLMGWNTKREIGAVTRRGRIPLRSAGFDYDGDGDVNRYTHEKFFTISGMYDGNVTNLSFTGSSNWTNRGTNGDEIIHSQKGLGIRRQYTNHWQAMWSSNRYTRNAYTTTASDYLVYRTALAPNGTPYTRVITKTRKVVVNRPDGLTAGETWEND